MTKDALISECGKYRYWLMRTWDVDRGCLDCVLLNPSTADATKDDATIRRLIGFAARRGHGSVRVYNLFAYRATNPKELRLVSDPVGPDNDAWLDGIRGTVLCAWGNHAYKLRECQVIGILRKQGCDLVILGLTKNGYPKHPVRLPYGKATWEKL
jgi:hypothetical protein